MEVTRLLLADNIRHRLVTSGLSVAGLENDVLSTATEQDSVTDKARRSMRSLCTELYQKHHAQFADMTRQLHIAPNTLQVDLERIMSDVFYDQVQLISVFCHCWMMPHSKILNKLKIHLLNRNTSKFIILTSLMCTPVCCSG